MRKSLLFFIFVSLFLGLSSSLSAHIHGIVLDEQGAPLIGANVVWSGTGIGTATDTAGLFKISPIRQTKVLITSYMGYRSDTTLVTSADPLTIVLLPDDEQLDEITITERRQAVLRSRFSAFDVSSFGADELCKAACCNLSESFETSASVDVAYSDAATGAKQIRLLGLSGTYVQLLTENTPAVRGLAQQFGMEYIPGPWMESIQVSKGTSSVINGYEAITGQINVEYLKPQTQDPIAVNLMLNTELHAEANITGGWDIPIPDDPYFGRLSTGILAHYQEGAFPMDDNHDGFLDMPLNRNLNLLNRWYYKNDTYTFQFLVRGLHDERHGGQRPTAMGTKMGITLPANPYLIDLRADRLEAFMKNGFVFDESSGMSLGIITAASYHDQHNTYGPRDWTASQANAYLNAIFQNSWYEEQLTHKLSAGASMNFDQYNESLTGTLVPMVGRSFPDHLYSALRREYTPGLFAEYTLTLDEQFSMIAGLRTDYSNRYGFFLTPRLNLRYAPFPWWTLRASAGLGHRSPNLVADNAAYLPSSRSWDVNALGLTPQFYLSLPDMERSVNTGLTSVWDIPVGGRNLQLSAEYYYTRFYGGLIADLDASPNSVVFRSIGTNAASFSHTAQVEASMEILRGWTLTAAFRYNDVRQTSWNANTGQLELREKPLQNRFKGIISTSYQTPLKKWQFDFTAQFNGPGRMPDGVVASGTYATTDGQYYPYLNSNNSQYYEQNGSIYHRWYPQLLGQITKYWRTCSLYLGAENMTNFKQDHPIAGSYNTDGVLQLDGSASQPFDASMVWAPTTGWKIYLGFRWNLYRE